MPHKVKGVYLKGVKAHVNPVVYQFEWRSFRPVTIRTSDAIGIISVFMKTALLIGFAALTAALLSYAIYAAGKIQRLETRLRAVEAQTERLSKRPGLQAFAWPQSGKEVPLLDAPGRDYRTNR